MKGAVGIFFGFDGNVHTDDEMKSMETVVLKEVVHVLEEKGFSVVTIDQATADDFVGWITGTHEQLGEEEPVALLWSAHGDTAGLLQTADGSELGPDSVSARLGKARLQVHESVRLAIFSSCHTGAHAQRWHSALGGKTTVVGYDGLAILSDVLDLYSGTGGESATLDDLFRRYLMNPAIGF